MKKFLTLFAAFICCALTFSCEDNIEEIGGDTALFSALTATDVTATEATLSVILGDWYEVIEHVEFTYKAGDKSHTEICKYGGESGYKSVAVAHLDPNTTYTLYATAVIGESGMRSNSIEFTTEDGEPDPEVTPNPNPDPETDPEVTPDPENNNTRHKRWAELPEEQDDKKGDYYYAYHMRADKSDVRNYTVCYSKDKMCPVWVASPMHNCYKGSANRTNAYQDDPDIPLTENGKWSGYTRGHMLGSSDRLVSTATNKQVFYHSNIAPQLGYVNGGGFNTGGGVWNNLESFTDGQWCSDTLYLVNGAYWANNNKRVSGTVIPTHYYKVMLRTKSGNSGKAVWNCTRDELKCAAFIVEHNTNQHGVKPHKGMMRSVEEMEKMTGHKFFTNVPNAPKDSYNASDWGL